MAERPSDEWLTKNGWQHFPGCSIHLAGGYRTHQWNDGTYGIYQLPCKRIGEIDYKTLEEAIAACNEHARENGVKS